MADVTDIKSVTDLLGQVTEGFKDFFNELETTLEKLAGIPTLLSGADNSLNKVTDSANSANRSLDITHKTSVNLINSIQQFGQDSLKTFQALSNSSHESIDSLGDVNTGLTTIVSTVGLLTLGGGSAFSSLNDSAKYTTSNISNTLNPVLEAAIKLLGGGNSALANNIKQLGDVGFKAVDSINNLETSLLALHGSSGSLTKILEQTGSTQSNLTKLTDEYTASIARTAQKTGSSVSSVIEYSKEIMKIPGLYDSVIKTPLGENLSFTEAAMKLTRGTTQDFGATLDIAKEQMLNFGDSVNSPLELISRMFNVTQSLGIPFSNVQSQIKNVSEQFKFLGDNTQGALTIFESLGEGLKKSKLGPAAMTEIVNDVVNSVGKLDIAQKSFLSSQSGGAGGLQGGYQIDQLLSEGKIDEVYKKIQASLKQEFGGKITTLKEGASDAGSAQQLTKEVAFLTQGPFGQIVKDAPEAYKLLEGFKNGKNEPVSGPTENQLQSGLSKNLDIGTSIQKNQFTELQKISNNTAIFQLYAQKNLGENVRDATRVDLGSQATPTSIQEATKNAPNSDKGLLYQGSDLISGAKELYNKIANSSLLEPTNVEKNLAKQNKQPEPSPEIAAEVERNNVLRQRQVERPDTVLANSGGSEQTVLIKVQSTGIDGKTEDRLVSTITAKAVKKIQILDNDAGITGH